MKGSPVKASLARWASIAVFVLVCSMSWIGAWDVYSTDRTDNCASSNCHGDFRQSPYVSTKDGLEWPNSLHEVHQSMSDFECDTCHSSGGRFPVRLGSSIGYPGLPAISCSGCHGRSADGTGTGSEGYGAGLRQHHFRNGNTSCLSCHTDSDPANKATVGENILPDYYGTLGFPQDSCNPAPSFPENYAASTLGLDNDGDDAYDEADTDCGAAVGTPGEAAGPSLEPVVVNGHDPVNGRLDISFGPACLASDYTLHWGDLVDVSIYGYAGQACNIGNSGAFTWDYPVNPGSVFFLIVANDGTVEGSYGADSSGTERPNHAGAAVCPLPQQLADRCD